MCSFTSLRGDVALRHDWVRNICGDERKGAWTINNSTHVCDLHFTEQSYHEAGRKRQRTTTWTNQMLIVDAVPTVFKCFPELLQATFSKQNAPTINNALQPKQKSKVDAMANGGKNTGEASQDAVGEQGGDDACAGG